MDIAHTHPELLREVGLCNFDAKTTERICAHLLKARGDVGIVSNQVQYSLIDQRPHFAMAEVCRKYEIKLVTYGTFVSELPCIIAKWQCGGFLSDRWVGVDEPDIYSGGLNTSQRKVSRVTRIVR